MENWRAKTLLQLSKFQVDSWTVDDAIKGTSILGGTGSGKTSASGKAIALKYLKENWGGIVLCAKPEEASLWEEYCEEAGRESDKILFKRGAVHTEGDFKDELMVFNPLHYEMQREGAGAKEAQNITNIFMNIYRMGNRIAGEGDTHEERYWDTALKRCLNRTIELINLAGEELTYKNMVNVISTCVELDFDQAYEAASNERNKEDDDIQYKNSEYCLKCLAKAWVNIEDDDEESATANAFGLALNYFTKIMPQMGDKTRTVIVESFMGLADPFLSGLLYEHFSGVTNLFPEQTYKEGKIIILDFSVKEFLDLGIMAQSIFKLLFQQAIERRNVEKYPRPVFLWADEAQYFVNPYDQIFLTTARSSRAATVFLSQNMSNYYAVMGSGSDAKARVDSLMGNLATKIFHANSDAVTNEYASRLIGSTVIYLDTLQVNKPLVGFEIQTSESRAAQFLPQVQPKKFTTLKTGGESNSFDVEAIIFVTGKIWADQANYLETTFSQNFNKP